MLILSPDNWPDYELIDCGNFEKLERFGEFVLRRPEPKAVWASSLAPEEWRRMAHTTFTAGAGFGKSGKEDSGTWNTKKGMADRWQIGFRYHEMNLRLRLALTSFKHVGVFPEQAPNWRFIYDSVKSQQLSRQIHARSSDISEAKLTTKSPKVLNLFSYTGGASLAARAAGAEVTHLDSVKQVVTWARENMESSGLDNIRWIIDDALKFVQREVKRGNVYQGILLDPPAYGHGIDGNRWKLDENILEMVQCCKKILAPQDSFLLLNLYSNGFSALVADTLTTSVFGKTKQSECGELVLQDRFGKRLPLSVFSRIKL